MLQFYNCFFSYITEYAVYNDNMLNMNEIIYMIMSLGKSEKRDRPNISA